MNGWSEARLLWRLERSLLEWIAGGRTVVLATGNSGAPPSRKNPEIDWIFSTTVYESEIATTARRVAPGRARLAIVGRQLEAEGARIIMRALPRLAGEFPGVTLDVVGHGLELPALVRFSDDLQVRSRVTFHGALGHDRVLGLLGRSDLLCLPTPENESTRQTIVEALACGVPVIAGVPWLADCRCGAVLNLATPDAVADAVAMCLRDPERYRAMSMAALETSKGYALDRWRAIVRERLERAWGPLQSVPAGIPVDARA